VRNLLPVLTWLGQHGLRVPADVSIIHMIDDPLLEFLYPPVTTYRLDSDKLYVSDTQIKKNGQRFEKPFCLNAICTAAALPLHHA